MGNLDRLFPYQSLEGRKNTPKNHHPSRHCSSCASQPLVAPQGCWYPAREAGGDQCSKVLQQMKKLGWKQTEGGQAAAWDLPPAQKVGACWFVVGDVALRSSFSQYSISGDNPVLNVMSGKVPVWVLSLLVATDRLKRGGSRETSERSGMGGQKLIAAGRFSCVSSETNQNVSPWVSSDCGDAPKTPHRPELLCWVLAAEGSL